MRFASTFGMKVEARQTDAGHFRTSNKCCHSKHFSVTLAANRMISDSPGLPVSTRAGFQTTRWSLVVAAGASESAGRALNELCAAYWRPIYAEFRRRGQTAEDAQDLTQDFLARLLQQKSFGRAEEEKGRFRSYLLGALDYFLANHQRAQRAQKRGGGAAVLSLNADEAESWYSLQPANGATPAEAFDHGWAMLLMDRALLALEADYEERGQGAVFALLKPWLATDAGMEGYANAAAQAGMTENSFRVAVHRLRKRFRQGVREQVEMTLADPAEVDAEMRHLFGMS